MKSDWQKANGLCNNYILEGGGVSIEPDGVSHESFTRCFAARSANGLCLR